MPFPTPTMMLSADQEKCDTYQVHCLGWVHVGFGFKVGLAHPDSDPNVDPDADPNADPDTDLVADPDAGKVLCQRVQVWVRVWVQVQVGFSQPHPNSNANSYTEQGSAFVHDFEPPIWWLFLPNFTTLSSRLWELNEVTDRWTSRRIASFSPRFAWEGLKNRFNESSFF